MTHLIFKKYLLTWKPNDFLSSFHLFFITIEPIRAIQVLSINKPIIKNTANSYLSIPLLHVLVVKIVILFNSKTK